MKDFIKIGKVKKIYHSKPKQYESKDGSTFFTKRLVVYGLGAKLEIALSSDNENELKMLPITKKPIKQKTLVKN